MIHFSIENGLDFKQITQKHLTGYFTVVDLYYIYIINVGIHYITHLYLNACVCMSMYAFCVYS